MDEKVINMLEHIQSRLDSLEKMQNSLDNLNQKVDNNHIEIVNKLDTLEKNQDAIMRYIINSDTAFQKSEVAFDFISKFKEAFSK